MLRRVKEQTIICGVFMQIKLDSLTDAETRHKLYTPWIEACRLFALIFLFLFLLRLLSCFFLPLALHLFDSSSRLNVFLFLFAVAYQRGESVCSAGR